MTTTFDVPEKQIRTGVIGSLDEDDGYAMMRVSIDVGVDIDTDQDECMLSIDVRKNGEHDFDHGLWVDLTLAEAITIRNALDVYIEMTKHINTHGLLKQ